MSARDVVADGFIDSGLFLDCDGKFRGGVVQSVESATGRHRLISFREFADVALAALRDAGYFVGKLDERHIVDYRVDGWSIQHPVVCRPDLLACPIHQAVNRQAGEGGDLNLSEWGRWIVQGVDEYGAPVYGDSLDGWTVPDTEGE